MKKTLLMLNLSRKIILDFLDVFLAYSDKYDPYERIQELASWFEKFQLDFACMYFNEPDSTGHSYGPDTKVKNK